MNTICLRPYPVPKLHEEMFKKEVEHLVLVGVLEVAIDSEWVSPYFAQPKPKSNQVRFLIDLSNLNKKIKRKPYDMPKTHAVLFKLEVF